MRHYQSTVSRKTLQAEVERELLALLPWKDYGRKVKGRMLVEVLVLAATLHTSLSSAVRRCVQVGCETMRKALHANLPKTEMLIDPLRVGLQARLPRRLRRGKRLVAIDLHERSYYGNFRQTPGVRGGKRKAGTKWFWAYATGVIVDDGERWTIGITPVHKGEAMEVIVERLCGQIAAAEVRIGRLLLDRGFYSAKVVAWLQGEKVPFLMPVIRRGKGDNGTNRFFRRKMRGIFTYTWASRDCKHKKAQGPIVTVNIACVPSVKGKKSPMVYAYWGSFGSLQSIRRTYRWFRETYKKRFGIETSYRQLGEAMGMTTSRSEAYRLLLVGIALLLRNLWVWSQQLMEGLTMNLLLDELRAAIGEALATAASPRTQTLAPSRVAAGT